MIYDWRIFSVGKMNIKYLIFLRFENPFSWNVWQTVEENGRYLINRH